ncbi:hypothetical protein B5V00_16555 [Geothermobacter hydrogeniphilus]|uniref:HEPN domain-containing protein n=1 Tax=Geothermobacter hydrogeniphilus TaxID=1969733 RepID=A0A1X0XJU1_9BACT|nr:hypothetical protein B5V00_16555 [Geothermobacter hydrogeniphilus]
MTLKSWAENRWLRPHQSSRQEISDLLMIVDRDLRDARAGVSDDWRFGIAYNAALKLCTILLHAEGYRPERTLQHYRTIQALPLILGDSRKADADYLDACRAKRNIVEYDRIGAVSADEANELIGFAEEFREDVLTWLRRHHSDLV